MTYTHGMSGTRLHRIWKSMRTRCNNPNCLSYKNYGGRGIKICDEWDEFLNFYNWAIYNGYSDNLTLDRIDNNSGYRPDNCRWVTVKEQCNNQRKNIYVTYNGKKCHPKEVSELSGISFNTIYSARNVQGITDFTDFKPRNAEYKNITKRKCGYELVLKGKYIGTYPTAEEAMEKRDILRKEYGL